MVTFSPFHYRLVPDHINKISISLGSQLLSFPQSKIGEKKYCIFLQFSKSLSISKNKHFLSFTIATTAYLRN